MVMRLRVHIVGVRAWGRVRSRRRYSAEPEPPRRSSSSPSSSSSSSSSSRFRESSAEAATQHAKAKEQLSEQVAEQWELLKARNKEGKLFQVALSAHGGVLFGVGLIVAVGMFLFVFREPLKADTVKGTADVAKRVISEKKVQDEALEATKSIVSQILRDDPSLELLVKLLKNLVQQKDTEVALAGLIKRLFEDQNTKENTKVFVAKVLTDEWIQDKVIALANVGLHQLANDDNMRDMFIEFLRSVTMSTLRDEHIQFQTGNALYNAAKTSVGLSPTAIPTSQEEKRLQTENQELRNSLQKARLEVAVLQARLVHVTPLPSAARA